MWAQLKEFGYDCDSDENKPHWSFPANKDMELMKKVYISFLDIGVNSITTNTYHYGSTLDQNLPGNLKNEQQNAEYFQNTCNLLGNLVRQREDVHVWGSVGTLAVFYHNMSEYTGSYVDLPDFQITASTYYTKILTLFQEKTNIRRLVFETISSAAEGCVVIEVLKKFPEMKAVISFTFKDNACFRHGEKVSTITDKMTECEQVLGIGINCTDPENVLPVLKTVEKNRFSEVFVYPNMGDSRFLNEGADESDVFSQEMVFDWALHGATAIGGCCGVTEAQIRILKKLIDNVNFN